MRLRIGRGDAAGDGPKDEHQGQGNALRNIGERLNDENRTIAERRAFTWRTVFFGFLRSRRRSIRRADDDDPFGAGIGHDPEEAV